MNDHGPICPCDECSADAPCVVCGGTPCHYVSHLHEAACSVEHLRVLEDRFFGKGEDDAS